MSTEGTCSDPWGWFLRTTLIPPNVGNDKNII
jgi:hypothetical protein